MAHHQEAIKESIKKSIKQIQVLHDQDDPLETNHLTENLCGSLEAFFLYELKSRTPCFWDFVSAISHKETLKKVKSFPLLRTDIGRSRAWIRVVLNEGFVCSYLRAIEEAPRVANKFYNAGALMNNKEVVDIVKSFFLGMESFRFRLACNVSVLNQWTSSVLVLSGWTAGEPKALGVTSYPSPVTTPSVRPKTNGASEEIEGSARHVIALEMGDVFQLQG